MQLRKRGGKRSSRAAPSERGPAQRAVKRALRPSREQVVAAVESLYVDQLRPYGRILRKRIGELTGAADVDAPALRRACEAASELTVEHEDGGDWTALLCHGAPAHFVDVHSPTDIYPSSLWLAAAQYFESLEQETLPGGRYACAIELQARDAPFLRGLSLGQACHVVQLAISCHRLLGYGNGTLVPYGRSVSMHKERLAERRMPVSTSAEATTTLALATWENVTSGLQKLLEASPGPGPGSVSLSNLKRLFRSRFRLELSETALGYSKLFDLLQDPRLHDFCAVRLEGNGYVVVAVRQRISLAESLLGAQDPSDTVGVEPEVASPRRILQASTSHQSLATEVSVDTAFLEEQEALDTLEVSPLPLFPTHLHSESLLELRAESGAPAQQAAVASSQRSRAISVPSIPLKLMALSNAPSCASLTDTRPTVDCGEPGSPLYELAQYLDSLGASDSDLPPGSNSCAWVLLDRKLPFLKGKKHAEVKGLVEEAIHKRLLVFQDSSLRPAARAAPPSTPLGLARTARCQSSLSAKKLEWPAPDKAQTLSGRLLAAASVKSMPLMPEPPQLHRSTAAWSARSARSLAGAKSARSLASARSARSLTSARSALSLACSRVRLDTASTVWSTVSPRTSARVAQGLGLREVQLPGPSLLFSCVRNTFIHEAPAPPTPRPRAWSMPDATASQSSGSDDGAQDASPPRRAFGCEPLELDTPEALETPRQFGPWTLTPSVGLAWPPTASPRARERAAASPPAACAVPPTPSPAAFHYSYGRALVRCRRDPAPTELRLTGLV